MTRINENYLKLSSSYLFANIAKRVHNFQSLNPETDIIKLGIGDVTRALPSVCIEAFNVAVGELGCESSFRGYGPEQGFDFLRNKIALNDFKKRSINISADEIFISDGSKCDISNIQEIFDDTNIIAIPDPVYPVYLDTNVMAGRTGIYSNGQYDKVVYLESTKENNFKLNLPKKHVDLIYLCFPNNPTGATISKEELRKWVDFARDCKALILYDAAYEAFINDESLPRSIYEIRGASEVAIEFRSFSKTAGFTGVRCAYTIVPKDCLAYTKEGAVHSVHQLWKRRQTTKFNGVSYPVQRAAEATYTEEGIKQIKELIDYYRVNANLIRDTLRELGLSFTGCENSPYAWVETGVDSWSFFDLLLNKGGVVCTPGVGFGRCGNGFVRISAFNSQLNVKKAMGRVVDVLNGGSDGTRTRDLRRDRPAF